MRSERFVFNVFSIPLLFTVIPRPRRLGSDGLIVATSNSGFALSSIIFGVGGGSGMVQAVSGVALTSVSGNGAPCVQVPVMVLASSLILPSKLPLIAATAILRVEPL